jgi:hypothetical protein
LAVIGGLAARTGVMGAARAGVRVRPIPILDVALEGGIQGEGYSGASAMLGYGTIKGGAHF